MRPAHLLHHNLQRHQVRLSPVLAHLGAVDAALDALVLALTVQQPQALRISIDEPYNLEDGSLNACLQCDEDVSGDVFKTVAGRTRRNSGLASAICRPCETVWRIEHRFE